MVPVAMMAGSSPASLLPPGEVQVWRGRLDQHIDALAELRSTLSGDELERAAAFRSESDRNQFVLRRSFLRTVLARYLAIAPSDVRFSYGRYLKPLLDRAYHKRSLSFNLTHRRAIALAAVTRTMAVGIDVEMVEPVDDLEGLAARFFSEREREVLSAVAEAERLNAFLTAWTRKEAYLKARGVGLSREPALVDVHLDCLPVAQLQEADRSGGRGRVWRVETVVPAPGYIGAVVGRGINWRIRWMD
jgi:4'-phosphopantetheinyl transferase